MGPREAFDEISAAIAGDPRKRVAKSLFEDQFFGSFLVSFQEDHGSKCVVNDRGYVTIAEGADGTGRVIATVPSLHDADGQSLLRNLGL